jgi:hypothetical protein
MNPLCKTLVAACLAALAGPAAGCHPPAAGCAADVPREARRVSTPKVTPQWLAAHGFAPEGGLYVRKAVALGELTRAFGFAPASLEAEPGRDPDEPRCTVEVHGGRLTVDYADPTDRLDDPAAVVDASVLVYPDSP